MNKNLSKHYAWDLTFMKIAILMAEHSTCSLFQVGAVLTKNNRVLSTGYNGVPGGVEHCNEVFKRYSLEDFKNPEIRKQHHAFSSTREIHAETNAILDAGKRGTLLPDSTLYVTLMPCSDCAKLLVTSGITRIVYLNEYDLDIEGPETLRSMGVVVEQLIIRQKDLVL